MCVIFFFSSRGRHTRCALVTGVQTCALPIFERPIPVTRAGLDRMRDVCTPEERCRLILCDEDGPPHEPAALWLTEVGQPVRPYSWEVIFTRACKRCEENGFPLSIRDRKSTRLNSSH